MKEHITQEQKPGAFTFLTERLTDVAPERYPAYSVKIICAAAMEEYANQKLSSQSSEIERLTKELHDHNNMCQGKLNEQLESLLPELKANKAEIERLREALNFIVNDLNEDGEAHLSIKGYNKACSALQPQK